MIKILGFIKDLLAIKCPTHKTKAYVWGTWEWYCETGDHWI